MERTERQQVVASQTKPYMGIDAAQKRDYIFECRNLSTVKTIRKRKKHLKDLSLLQKLLKSFYVSLSLSLYLKFRFLCKKVKIVILQKRYCFDEVNAVTFLN